MESTLPYNGEMFRLGRQYRDFTQQQLGLAVGVQPSTISRIENGVIQPSDDLAQRVSREFRLPLGFFKQPEHLYGLPLSVHPMWRKRAAVSQGNIDRALATMNIHLLHLRRLTSSLRFAPILPLPNMDVESYDGDVPKIAQALRRTWQMPAGPVKDLTAWVERAGCFVVHLDLPDESMDGVTLRAPDLAPCIFLNRRLPADRMRFTLAHELGHLIMHRYPTQDMEDEANKFAGSFLVPAADIQPYFAGRRITLQLLASLKPEWRVAMQSLLYRAIELEYIDKNQSRYLWMQFNKLKMRMREPPELDFPIEQPTLAPRVVQLHLQELGYSMADLQTVLNMYEEELVELHAIRAEPGRPQLRIV